MLIPIGLEEDVLRRTPWVSYGLIALNVAVSLTVWIAGVPLDHVGFIPGRPDASRHLVGTFAHGDIFHLVGNMLFLYLTGPFLEDAYGRILFPALYLVSAGVADRVYAAHDPASLIPVVGASGAIAGIMGAFLIRFGRRHLRWLWMPFFPLPWIRREFSVPAFVYLPLWFFGQLLLAKVAPTGSEVAYWAHVGGFAFGAGTALVIGILGIEKKFITPGILAKIHERSRFDESRRSMLSLRKDQTDVERAYSACLISGDHRGLAEQATALLDLYAERGDKAAAFRLIADATGLALSDLPPRFLWNAAEFCAKHGMRDQALSLYKDLAATHPGDPAALRALLRIVTIARASGDEKAAAKALSLARGHPSFSPEWARAFQTASGEHRRTAPSR